MYQDWMKHIPVMDDIEPKESEKFQTVKLGKEEIKINNLIDCITLMIDYCKKNHKDCEKCQIEYFCEKYFVREPRRWRDK